MVYYNDIEPFVVNQIHRLIEKGWVPDGIVDGRSIHEVTPEDLQGHKRCHFFAGILGWELALQYAGWPEDWEVFTGSAPCPPFSTAGRKKCPKCKVGGIELFAGKQSFIQECGCAVFRL